MIITDKYAFWRWPAKIRELSAELEALKVEHEKLLAGQSKLLEWVKVTHRVKDKPTGIKAMLQAGKRLAVVALFLFVGVSVLAQPAPPILRNPMTTNSHFGPVPTEGEVPIWNDTAKKWSNGFISGASTPHVWTNDNGTLKPVDFPTNILFRVVVPDDGIGTNFHFNARTFRTNAQSKLFQIYNGGSNALTIGHNGQLMAGRGNGTPFPGAVLYGIFDTALGETNQQEVFVLSKNSAIGYSGGADMIVDTNYGALILTATKEGGTKFSRFAVQAGAGLDPELFNTFSMQALVDGADYFHIDPNFTLLQPTNYLFSSSVRITNIHTLMSLQNSNFPVLEVDGVGDIKLLKKIPYSWPSAQGAAGTALTNDGAGNLGWGTVSGSGGGLTTNANQFLGVPLSIKSGAFLTNTVLRNPTNLTRLNLAAGTIVSWPSITWEESTPGAKSSLLSGTLSIQDSLLVATNLFIQGAEPNTVPGKVWTATNSDGSGTWSNAPAGSGSLTTNVNQFLGVPLSVKDSALLTNTVNFGAGFLGTVTNILTAPQFLGTNVVFDGSLSSWFQFNPATGPETNYVFTNLAAGQTIRLVTFVTNGTTVRLKVDTTDIPAAWYVGNNGTASALNSNAYSIVTISRDSLIPTTNVTIQTRDLEVAAGYGMSFATNFTAGIVTQSVQQIFQIGSTVLTNLAGTGAITNLFTPSLSNATIKPLVVGVGDAAGATNTTGQIRGLEAGANITLSENQSNIVITAAAGGGGSQVFTNDTEVRLAPGTGASNYLFKSDYVDVGITNTVFMISNSLPISDTNFTVGLWKAGTNYFIIDGIGRIMMGHQVTNLLGDIFDVGVLRTTLAGETAPAQLDIIHADKYPGFTNTTEWFAQALNTSGQYSLNQNSVDQGTSQDWRIRVNTNWSGSDFRYLANGTLRIRFSPGVDDGGANPIYFFDTRSVITAAQLMSWRNQGTNMMSLNQNGDLTLRRDLFASNLVTAGTLKLIGGQGGSVILRTDINTNIVAATIGSGLSFDGTTLSATGGGIATNTLQFGASTTLTIKDSAMLTNLQNIGVLNVTNPPGWSGSVRLWHTNGTAYTALQAPTNQWLPTNQLILSITNPVAGQVLGFNNVTIADGVAAISVTNMSGGLGVYRNIYIDAAGMVPGATLGAQFDTTEQSAPTNRMFDSYIFSDAVSNIVQFKLAFPMEWDLGTIKYRVFYMSTNASTTATNVWQLEATAFSHDDPLDANWGTGITLTNKIVGSNDLNVTIASSALTIGGTPAAQDLTWFRVKRMGAHADDNDNGQVKLLGIWLQYKESVTPVAQW